MFLVVAIISLLNAFAHNLGIVMEYRVNIGGVPINIFDFLLAFGLVVSLFRNRNSENFFRAGLHPALLWILSAFALAILSGMIGTATNRATSREITTTVRNMLSIPISVYLGYCALANLKGNRRFVLLSILSGIVVSVMILMFFSSALEQRAGQEQIDINGVRAVAYISNYAGLACAVLLFSVVCGIRIMPAPLALMIAGFCLIGQFATLSRSDWLACLAGILAVYTLLPRGNRGRKILQGMGMAVVMFLSLWAGLYFASQISGRDFYDKMVHRVLTMLPGDNGDLKEKAWNTRLGGTFAELELWVRSPLYGQGFGIQDALTREGSETSYRHNTWTSTLAETGLMGFTAMCLVIFSMMVVGRRMVRDRIDAGSVLMGALGVISGFYYIILGLTTMSFNQMRWAIPMAMICGAVLRSRAMQRVTAQTYAGYIDPSPEGMTRMLDADGDPNPLDLGHPLGNGNAFAPEEYAHAPHAASWPN